MNFKLYQNNEFNIHFLTLLFVFKSKIYFSNGYWILNSRLSKDDHKLIYCGCIKSGELKDAKYATVAIFMQDLTGLMREVNVGCHKLEY